MLPRTSRLALLLNRLALRRRMRNMPLVYVRITPNRR